MLLCLSLCLAQVWLLSVWWENYFSLSLFHFNFFGCWALPFYAFPFFYFWVCGGRTTFERRDKKLVQGLSIAAPTKGKPGYTTCWPKYQPTRVNSCCSCSCSYQKRPLDLAVLGHHANYSLSKTFLILGERGIFLERKIYRYLEIVQICFFYFWREIFWIARFSESFLCSLSGKHYNFWNRYGYIKAVRKWFVPILWHVKKASCILEAGFLRVWSTGCRWQFPYMTCRWLVNLPTLEIISDIVIWNSRLIISLYFTTHIREKYGTAMSWKVFFCACWIGWVTLRIVLLLSLFHLYFFGCWALLFYAWKVFFCACWIGWMTLRIVAAAQTSPRKRSTRGDGKVMQWLQPLL